MTERYSRNYSERVYSIIDENLKNPLVQDILKEEFTLENKVLDFYDIIDNNFVYSRTPFLISKENQNKIGQYPKELEFLVNDIKGKEYGLDKLKYEKVRSDLNKDHNFRRKFFKKLRGIKKPVLLYLDKFEDLLDFATVFDSCAEDYRNNFLENYMNKLK